MELARAPEGGGRGAAMARYRSERGQGGGGGYGRIKKALSKVEFEILFVMFAGVFYITSKYFLYVRSFLPSFGHFRSISWNHS